MSSSPSFGDRAIRPLSPAYFALVMATGILSIAGHLQGFHRVAMGLMILAWVGYLVLLFFTGWRVLCYRRELVDDFKNHAVAPGFFTTAASTGVIGASTLTVAGLSQVAWILWWLCLVLGLSLVYGVFTVLIVRSEKPGIEKGLNGGWLVAVVAIQSISVLGALLAQHLGHHREMLLIFSMNTWLFGGMLYMWIISLIFLRYLFYPFKALDMAPPYWINMGAVAISTLAGSCLIAQADALAVLAVIKPFLIGGTLLFWATATWWIPMLLTLGFWRHVVQRYPLTYSPVYWGAIFPLGMYSVCSFRLHQVVDLPFLGTVSTVFWWVAATCWTCAFLGMVRSFFVHKNVPA